MSDATRSPPTFVYDDDCGFCTWWAETFDRRTDLRVVGYTDLGPALRARLPDDYRDCSHLVTDDAVYSCGASVERALLRTEAGSHARPVADRLDRLGAYRTARERGYRWVADRRSLWGELLSQTPPARR
ncbi:DCC1-like thiol-disulfide oxidoreductase family protein [Candidatus Halobonum tyrrellensis]|uniref:Thiol-disulfide oxidoreductase DCC n=1 Tax=Candidatus Halobonum tyrrellensis G22 TaxID=1324957 RepID=V4H9S3_9EURY|nr:DCC1-like thiol-disulfide oxidoreductase family protein [Candidatus Halobonum tyrrellensis]ESP87435.1 hypothetical protein K933_14208 [Candidatus Halobonum tyrrellensis G22]